MMVDLPHPLPPTSATVFPGSMCRSNDFNTWKGQEYIYVRINSHTCSHACTTHTHAHMHTCTHTHTHTHTHFVSLFLVHWCIKSQFISSWHMFKSHIHFVSNLKHSKKKNLHHQKNSQKKNPLQSKADQEDKTETINHKTNKIKSKPTQMSTKQNSTLTSRTKNKDEVIKQNILQQAFINKEINSDCYCTQV